jgi:hypothetical protein
MEPALDDASGKPHALQGWDESEQDVVLYMVQASIIIDA